jgi:exopolyphosphatase / guanosine-5'-triphosphate,3'-diphosphate pyrophosphatase
MLPIISISLGSNGFHLVGTIIDGQKLKRVSSLGRTVQIESFMDASGCISEEGIQRMLQVLEEYSSYLRSHPTSIVGAIATGTFRRARNRDEVIERANAGLGHSIQVLSGIDEGLLCYQGIAAVMGLSDENRLVIDIGGGSTEIMIAQSNRLSVFESLDIGCVSVTQQVFNSVNITQDNIDAATLQVDHYLCAVFDKFLQHNWHDVVFCGGSATALYSVLSTNRLCGRFLTKASTDRFFHHVLESGSADKICGSIVPADRTRLLPAGALMMQRLFDGLNIEKATAVASSATQGLTVSLAQKLMQTRS